MQRITRSQSSERVVLASDMCGSTLGSHHGFVAEYGEDGFLLLLWNLQWAMLSSTQDLAIFDSLMILSVIPGSARAVEAAIPTSRSGSGV